MGGRDMAGDDTVRGVIGGTVGGAKKGVASGAVGEQGMLSGCDATFRSSSGARPSRR
jgi:hypothetical protein